MKAFQGNEIRDFAAAIVDESTVQAAVQWVSDNMQPDDVFDRENLKSSNPAAMMMEAIQQVLDDEMTVEKSRDEFGGYVLPDDLRQRLKRAIA